MVKKIKIADKKRILSLHQAEYANKMASIGRLAANVAHEINNPLAIINEKAGLIKDLFVLKGEYANDERLLNTINVILSSVKRAGTITKRLLTFARKFDLTVVDIDLDELMREMISFFKREVDYKSITVNLDIPEDMPLIRSDFGRLQQIFVNIANNAIAAVSDGGRIDISAGFDNNRKDRIFIQFSDNGHGIPEKDLNRIFEPFFSTKTGKGGTGLGLSITYNLIQELGGEINVQSAPDEGTTLRVTLPINTSQEGEN